MVDTMSLKVSARQSMLAAVFEKQNELPRTELLLTICFKALAEALAAVQAIFLPIIPMIGASTFKSVSEFQIRNCSTNTTAHICCSCEPCIVSHKSSTATKSCTLQEHGEESCKAHDDSRSLQGADRSGMVGNEGTMEWVEFAKNKEEEDEEEDDNDNDDEDEDDDGDGEEEDGDGEEEEEGGGEEEEEGGEEEEGIEGGPGGGEDDDDDDDDDDDNDNDNGDDDDDDDEDGDEDEDEDDEVKGDQDDEDEDGIVGEDEDDEDGVEDEDDEDDETPEPPQKKRK